MESLLRNHVAAALMLLAPAAATLVAPPAAAQHRVAVAQPVAITSLSLDGDQGLSPGSTLSLQVHASPDADWAHVELGQSGIRVALRERAPGRYVGSYTVRRVDRIDPLQLMTVRGAFDGRQVVQNFSYPASFQALATGGPSASAPSIERFVMRPAGRLEAGRELRFRMVGAPGGDAWLDIPGVIRGVDLDETRPGVYEGSYTIRRRDNLEAFSRAVATLQSGDRRATARLEPRGDPGAADGAGRDERGPRIVAVTPADGARVSEHGRTHIFARLSDDRSGVDASSVRLRINGDDVTDQAQISAGEVHFRDDLEPGRYTVELAARDRAGNTTRQAWSFDVVDEDRYGDRGDALPLVVTSHSDNAVLDAGGNLVIGGHTAPYAQVRVQVESVAGVAGWLGVSQQVADRTVRADRNGRFAVEVPPRGLAIPGMRYDVRLTATSGNETAQERLTLRQRQG